MDTGNDEFDIEIEDAFFDIEDENENARPTTPTTTSDLITETPHGGRDPTRNSEEEAISSHNTRAVLSENSMKTDTRLREEELREQPSLNNTDQTIVQDDREVKEGLEQFKEDNIKTEIDEDDEFDALLTQIDEKDFEEVPHKKLVKSCTTSNASVFVNLKSVNTRPNSDTPPNYPKPYKDERTSFLFASQSPTDSNALKRRFPGPAGILPKIRTEELKFVNLAAHPLSQQVSKLVTESSNKKLEREENRRNLDSRYKNIRMGKDVLSKAPWESLLQILNLNMKDESSLLKTLNIKSVRTKLRRLPGTVKVPFLAAVVQDDLNVALSVNQLKWKNPNIKLIDPTGVIVAALDKNFVEAYGNKIGPGTAMAFRNCGLIKYNKQVVLTVTKRNLLCLSTEKKFDEDLESSPIDTDVSVHKLDNGILVFHKDFEPEKVIEEYEDLLLSKTILEMNNEEYVHNSTNQIPLQLFTNVASIQSAQGQPRTVPNSDNLVQPRHDVLNIDEDSSAFDDDDDEEILKALENVDFLLEENNL